MNDDINYSTKDYHNRRNSPNKMPIIALLCGLVMIAVLLSVIVMNRGENNTSNADSDISNHISYTSSGADDSTLSTDESVADLSGYESGNTDESGDESQAGSESSGNEGSSDPSDESRGQSSNNIYEFSLTAEYCLVVARDSDKVLYSKNANQKAYPASITKLMTSIVALKYCDPNDVFTAGDELSLVQPGSSLAMIYKGHRLKLSMLIDAMMLPSGNDAAYVVAANAGRRIAGNDSLSAENAVSVFVDKMNEEAERLGCKDTHFANPDGFHDENHYTTASDLAIISDAALDNEVIRDSVKKEQVHAVYESGQIMDWINSNYLIRYNTLSTADRQKWYCEYATGLKTGSTSQAGSCFVASAKKGDREIIIVLLKCNDGTRRFEDALEIINTIF